MAGMDLSCRRICKTVWVVFLLVLGASINSAAVNLFLIPHKLLSGGVAGVGILLSYLTPISVGIWVAALNVPLFIMAWKKVDLKFCIYSLVGTFAFAATLTGFHFMSRYNIVHDPLLAAIYGGMISGIGTGFVMRSRGCLGGTDIISIILRRHYSLSVGMVGLYINIFIVSVLAVRFGIELGLLTLFSQYIGAKAIDQVVMGIGMAQSLMIVSDKSEEIAKYIMKDLYRGVTFLHGEGAYGRTPKDVIWCVVSTTQLARIKAAVKKIDPRAFIAVSATSEIIGKGFYKSPF